MNQSKTWRKLSNVDPWMALSTISLIVLGLIMVFSASSITGHENFGDGSYFLKRQLTALALGVGLVYLMFTIQIRTLRRLSWIALIFGGGLLALTAIPSTSVEANHAARWVNIGGIRFQPSEFLKPILILYVAAYLAKKGNKIKDFWHGLVPLFFTVGGFLLLVLRQPDFGTAFVLAAVIGAMVFLAGAKWKHVFSFSVLSGLGALALVFTAAYRLRRVTSFLDPWKDPQGDGFQIIQSFVAFQRGGFMGQGLGDGTQKLFYLPEAHTDFIFSVIGEELGLLGSMAVILIFLVLVVQGLRLTQRLSDPFVGFLAFGFTMAIGLQAFCNMAVAMGMLPTKGMTLPLVSYGGSSLLSSLFMVGVLLSLSSTVSLSGRMARGRTK